MLDLANGLAARERDIAPGALGEQQVDDLPRRPVAEQLPERLFVPGDAVAFDEGDEVRGRVAAQRRLGEVRVGRDEAIGRGVEVGEVAPPAARDEDLPARRFGVLDHQHAASALAGLARAHQAGRAGAEDDDVVAVVHLDRRPIGRP